MQKMEDVGQEGRTVLFVSHNMGSILSLCQTGILIEDGKIATSGSIEDVVDTYLTKNRSPTAGIARRDGFDHEKHVLEQVEILDASMKRRSSFNFGETMNIVLHTTGVWRDRFGLEIRIRSSKQELIAYASSWINSTDGVFEKTDRILITIPNLKLVQDDYLLDFNLRIPHLYHVDAWWEAVQFTVANCRPPGSPISLTRVEHWGSMVLDDVTMNAIEPSGGGASL